MQPKPTYDELVDALITMSVQYLGKRTADCNYSLDHQFMCAGEDALGCLARLGIVEGSDRDHRFTAEGLKRWDRI